MRFITLTTDFGLRDWFVGTMKGVIGTIAPNARVVDLTQEIAPGDIRAGAFALAAGYSFFPPKTIHVAVVDPGVGSARRAIAVQTSRYLFVGPDNGVLSLALAKEQVTAIHALENKRFFLKELSTTFHGRDVFAPVAAHLSLGKSLRQLGQRLNNFHRLDWPEPVRTRNGVRGAVVYLDRFGNAITNIASEALRSFKGSPAVYVRRGRLSRITPFYQAAAPGRPVAVIGSSGFLEIAVNQGSATKQLGLRVGSTIEVRFVKNRRE